jgi:hypothetical protein
MGRKTIPADQKRSEMKFGAQQWVFDELALDAGARDRDKGTGKLVTSKQLVEQIVTRYAKRRRTRRAADAVMAAEADRRHPPKKRRKRARRAS